MPCTIVFQMLRGAFTVNVDSNFVRGGKQHVGFVIVLGELPGKEYGSAEQSSPGPRKCSLCSSHEQSTPSTSSRTMGPSRMCVLQLDFPTGATFLYPFIL